MKKLRKQLLGEDAGPMDKWPAPPPSEEKGKMARYLVHYGTWTVVSNMSIKYTVPIGMVLSYADGPLDNSTGIPYFYISGKSDFFTNIEQDNSVSMVVTLAESTERCSQEGCDPMSPLCARVFLIGKIMPVTNKGELAFAKDSLFSRHPAMKNWPVDQDWMFYKIDIGNVDVLDYFDGVYHVPTEEYFAADP